MRIVIVLGVAGLLSWLLRLLFITLIPASKLPVWLRSALEHGGAAVPAALVATAVVRGRGLEALLVPSPVLIALLLAGVVAWRFRQLGAVMAAAVGAFWLLDLAWMHLPA